jgi:hypothetical protein
VSLRRPDTIPDWPVLGEAALHGVVAMADWPREAASGLLHRSGGTLDTPDGWAPHRHPVVVVYGAYLAGATRLAGVRVPLGRCYQELGILVPGVVEPGVPTGTATAVVAMWADYFPAVWNGRNRYGFAKEEAMLRWCDASYVVVDGDGTLVCDARAEPCGEWRRGSPPPGLATIAAVFDAPLLGWSPAGRRVCTPSRWRLDEGAFRAVQASVTWHRPAVGGRTPTELVRRQVAAFEVRGVAWDLGWPAPVRDGSAERR